jgi:hypothetical protein
MARPDSLKILDIARHPDFKARIVQRLLKFVDYKMQGSDPNKADFMLAAQKAWSSDRFLETLGMLILTDPTLLVKTDPSTGGAEITDDEMSSRLEPNLLAWASYLA